MHFSYIAIWPQFPIPLLYQLKKAVKGIWEILKGGKKGWNVVIIISKNKNNLRIIKYLS